jgi:hypothetical protein
MGIGVGVSTIWSRRKPSATTQEVAMGRQVATVDDLVEAIVEEMERLNYKPSVVAQYRIVRDKLRALRHSKAMHLLQAGVNLVYIRDILGHADLKTTEIYARIDGEMKRRALEDAFTNVIKAIPHNVPCVAVIEEAQAVLGAGGPGSAAAEDGWRTESRPRPDRPGSSQTWIHFTDTAKPFDQAPPPED